MKAKEQNINQWDFQDILMSVVSAMAIMALYIGVGQFFSFDSNRFWYLIVTQIMFYLIIAASVLYFVVFKKSNSIKNFLGLENPEIAIRDGFLVFIAIVLATTAIDHFFEIFVNIKSSDVYNKVDKNLLKSMSFIGVFFAPFAEEVFFRGFLQPVFVRKFGVIWGIASISLLFAVLHILYIDNISAFLSIASVGLILSFAKEKTGSLVPCIIAHFLNNLVAVMYINWL